MASDNSIEKTERGNFFSRIIRPLKIARVRAGYLFIAPITGLIILFRIVPILFAVRISFTKYNVINPSMSKYIGLRHYTTLLNDKLVWMAVWNTTYYTIGAVLGGLALGLIIALIIRASWFKMKNMMRIIYFIPVLLSMTVAALLWSWLYHPSFGLLNKYIGYIGIPPQNWLGNPSLVMPSIIIMSIWKGLGFNVIVLLAGLLAIPAYCYESAELDGASKLQQFLYITIPLLKPTIMFLTVMGIIWSYQVFDQVYIMTAGGPANQSLVIVYYLWQNAFQWTKMGYGTAIAWLLFGILISFSLLQIRLYGEEVEY